MTEPMPKGLVRVDPAEVGLTRRRRGRGWSFFDVSGAPITDAEVIARIKALVIPPAWQDVWISPDAQGHIQAVGTDVAGGGSTATTTTGARRATATKHDRVLTLGRSAGEGAHGGRRAARRGGLGRDRVLAGGVRMLDLGVFRAAARSTPPGDDDEDGTFGLRHPAPGARHAQRGACCSPTRRRAACRAPSR